MDNGLKVIEAILISIFLLSIVGLMIIFFVTNSSP